MKLGEVILVILFTMLIFGPLYYLYYWSNSRKRRIITLLNERAKALGLTLSDMEIWYDKGLAYDATKKMLLYHSVLNNAVIDEYIDLSQVKKIKILTSDNQIIIQFDYFNNTITKLEIYNAQFESPFESGQAMIVAKKWVEIVNGLIKPQINKAA